ncbi:hypothetical protein HN873_008536 [Arachis hypogaea]
MRGKPIITMLEEMRCYVIRIMARNKKALVGYSGRLTPTQQSILEREKRERATNGDHFLPEMTREMYMKFNVFP